MDLGLTNRVAVVTGASRGIGLAIVRALVDEGARVIAGAKSSSDELEELARTGTVQAVQVDLADERGPSTLVAHAGDRLDILVNNVGIAPPRVNGFVHITDEEWYASINLNLMAAVRASRSAIPVMVAAGRGAIVNMSSVNAFLPDPGVLDYCATKGALHNLSKSLSKEFGPQGIRVNAVCPGPVSTSLWLGEGGVAETVSRASGQSSEEIAAGAAAQSVTGRFTKPEEVADLVVLLASDRTSNVTGASFTIDGGLITTL
jgi:NAD(P)-dependent dehydrogenase (short-subunit alcohol dehydrogenase family)